MVRCNYRGNEMLLRAQKGRVVLRKGGTAVHHWRITIYSYCNLWNWNLPCNSLVGSWRALSLKFEQQWKMNRQCSCYCHFFFCKKGTVEKARSGRSRAHSFSHFLVGESKQRRLGLATMCRNCLRNESEETRGLADMYMAWQHSSDRRCHQSCSYRSREAESLILGSKETFVIQKRKLLTRR